MVAIGIQVPRNLIGDPGKRDVGLRSAQLLK